LTGGIREGVKGEPPVGLFSALAGKLAARRSRLRDHSTVVILRFFFFSSADFLAYDTIPEELYLSGSSNPARYRCFRVDRSISIS
jgi:hypothetical protein